MSALYPHFDVTSYRAVHNCEPELASPDDLRMISLLAATNSAPITTCSLMQLAHLTAPRFPLNRFIANLPHSRQLHVAQHQHPIFLDQSGSEVDIVHHDHEAQFVPIPTLAFDHPLGAPLPLQLSRNPKVDFFRTYRWGLWTKNMLGKLFFFRSSTSSSVTYVSTLYTGVTQYH